MARLLEFYNAKDLRKFGDTIDRRGWDWESSWNWLYDFTVEDYRQTEINPILNNYILLLDYYTNRNI